MLDESPEETPVETQVASQAEDPFSIFAFPRGALAGLCLHEMFEHLDFSRYQMTQTAPLVERKLDEYGFDHAWTPALCEMIHRVLTVPLALHDLGLTLSRISAADRLNELEFTFPLNRITPDTLSRIFREHGQEEIPDPAAKWTDRLAFSPVKGFMRGFMDLVFQFDGRFYLVDWKSNFLGVGSTAYEQGALTEAMNAHAYVLQYHLYALALDRYLALRLEGYEYETHFGDIFYIFLRGVDPEQDPSRGIYSDRPDARLIQALRTNLIDEA
jgi:exodeoxyribonuclease V beta subunit